MNSTDALLGCVAALLTGFYFWFLVFYRSPARQHVMWWSTLNPKDRASRCPHCERPTVWRVDKEWKCLAPGCGFSNPPGFTKILETGEIIEH